MKTRPVHQRLETRTETDTKEHVYQKQYTVFQKSKPKGRRRVIATTVFDITSAKVDRFSKFFHHVICKKII